MGVLITRDFDAPKHRVYKEWTTPGLIERCWSARRGEVTTAVVDLRVGGKWRWVMMTDAGFEVAFHGQYLELVPDERMVFTDVFEGMPDAGARVAHRRARARPGPGSVAVARRDRAVTGTQPTARTRSRTDIPAPGDAESSA